MKRQEAKIIAETVSFEDIKKMFLNARTGIKDWEQTSRVNKGLTKGAAFNLLSKCVHENIHILSKINMVWEFGEWLPNYKVESKKKSIRNPAIHQLPVELKEDWLDAYLK